MSPKITFAPAPGKADTIAIGYFEKTRPGRAAEKLDGKTGGWLAGLLKNQQKFTGAAGQALVVPLPGKSGYHRAVLYGLGNPDKLTGASFETLGGRLYATLADSGAAQASIVLEEVKSKSLTADKAAALVASGLALRSYRFDKYKTAKKGPKAPFLEKVEIVTAADKKAAVSYADYSKAVQGTFFARDLVNEPPNVLYPDSMAKRIKAELAPLGVSVEIMDEKKLEKLGMGAFIAVGQGSDRPPRMVIMRWNGLGAGKSGRKAARPLAFVGKGVTFDTGGISIKPAGGMEEMKMDMGGAAAVVGLLKSLALRKAKVDVIGAVGLAENMLSGNAYRPSDIVTSHAGKTIEVLNTDAEGRLVLVDVLSYVQKTYNPSVVIDLATLTGAMMVALGYEYCGAFANDDALWNQLEGASRTSGEKLWRMPLDEAWRKDMEGSITDLQNLGKTGRYAGACTAAGFLEHFIHEGTRWAHLDIAGTAWIKSDRAVTPKGGTGFGVRLLDRFVAENYE